ncbi:hypothetical protein ABPG75_005266 [Micractinium tetrahymenae]
MAVFTFLISGAENVGERPPSLFGCSMGPVGTRGLSEPRVGASWAHLAVCCLQPPAHECYVPHLLRPASGVQIEEPHRVLPLNQICAGSLRALSLMVADQHGSAAMAATSAASSDASLAPLHVVLKPCSGERPHRDEQQLQAEAAAATAGAEANSSSRHNGLRGLAGLAGLGHRRVELSAPSAGSTPATARPVSPNPVDWSAPNGGV